MLQEIDTAHVTVVRQRIGFPPRYQLGCFFPGQFGTNCFSQSFLQQEQALQVTTYFATASNRAVRTPGNFIRYLERIFLQLCHPGEYVTDTQTLCDVSRVARVAHAHVLDHKVRNLGKTMGQRVLDALHDVLIGRITAEVFDRQYRKGPQWWFGTRRIHCSDGVDSNGDKADRNRRSNGLPAPQTLRIFLDQLTRRNIRALVQFHRL